MKKLNYFYLAICYPLSVHASFLESTLGTAVVNDATAAYYNPASLTRLSRAQFIGLGSAATFDTRFTGSATQTATGFKQSGTAYAHTNYFLPSFYMGIPTNDKITLGLAVVSNFFNREVDDHAILRYAQASNSTHDLDIVPAIGIKINTWLSAGAGLSLSRAYMSSEPLSGIPGLNIPDAHTHNQSEGSGLSGDIGVLFTPRQSTWIGFNFRRATTYALRGKSVFETNPPVVSNHYHYTFWIPARAVGSINHFVTKKLGFIGTVQRIEWHIFNQINMYGIATVINGQPAILNATVPYHLHDTWLFTIGTHYRATTDWIIRVAANYNQSPEGGRYQISNGNTITTGASSGYNINKHITIDASYAHAFVQNQPINVHGRYAIQGMNHASRNGIALKLTYNY